MANVKKNYSMPERSAELIEKYSKEVGLSQSAFVSLMVNQIDQVMTSLQGKDMASQVNAKLAELEQKAEGEGKESGAGDSGCD